MIQCPGCQKDNPADARFCAHCGTRLPLVCPSCQAELPPEARFCMHCGQSVGDVPTLSSSRSTEAGVLTGERRTVTAMFADVKGSTSLAEQIDVEAWVEIMNHVLQTLSAQIHRFGGEVDRYEGDGLVAFFGANAVHEDDPERAVLASLAMQEAVQGYALQLEAERGIELLLRVGLSTGEVVTTHVGDARQHGEETAMARAIAVAARLEPAAEPGTVLVSEDTYRLVAPLFEWQPLEPIAAKGIREPVAAYRPLAHRTVTDKGRGIPGLESPLVGRDEELAALQQAVSDLERGVGSIVTLVGEAGIGKSRLVAELRKRTTEHAPRNTFQWVEGRCLSYGASIAYLPWLDMLRTVLDVAPDTFPLTVREALHTRVEALCPDCLDAVYPYLCRLLSLPLEDKYETIRNLQGESLRAEVFWAVQTLVESAARQRPLVMVFEDLHWADATSLALLERVLALTDRAALLAICVFRPEVEHGCWQLKETAARLYRHRYTDLWLDALSMDESQALVGHLLHIEDLPEALRSRILDRAEGNPFYVEEILRTLIDDGAILYDDTTERWQATRELDDIPIPNTLHGVLTARIDRLHEETRRVLRLASVIGRVFFYRVLAEIAPSPPAPLSRSEVEIPARPLPGQGEGRDSLGTHLLALQRQQLIRERARVPELEYIFEHELTREAAYNGLLGRERRTYHRGVAEALERLYPEQVNERAGLLAYHWERAEEPDKAVEYLILAGEQARQAYANEEAVDYFQRALALMDELSLGAHRSEWRLAALSGLGKVYFGIGRVRDAESPLREAIALAEAMRKPARERVRLLWWLGETLIWLQRPKDALQLATAGLELLADDGESTEATLMNQHVAVTYRELGNRDMFYDFSDRTARFLKSLPYVEELRPAYITIALGCISAKRVQDAKEWLAALEAAADQAHDLRALGDAHRSYGDLCLSVGDLHRAIDRFQQAVEFWSRIGDAKNRALGWSCLGQVHLFLGCIQEAEVSVQRAFSCVETEDFRFHLPDLYWVQGTILLSLGRWQEVLDAYKQAGRLTQELGVPLGLSSCRARQAHVCLARKQDEEAACLFEEAIRLPNPTLWAENSTFLTFLLSGLDRAYADPRQFHGFCQRFRQEHVEELGPFPQQWELAGTMIQEGGSLVVDETFAGSHSTDWAWTDPLGDCSYTARDGLEIRAANGRGMWRVNQSAPRLMRQVRDDVIVQTVCLPATDDRPTIGGLLFWRDERDYLLLELGESGEQGIVFSGCLDGEEVGIGQGQLYEAAGRIYLRLERIGERVNALCSADGEQWYTVGHATFPAGDPLQVGMLAIGWIDRMVYPGAYPEGTAIRFESFQMWAL